MKIATLYVNPEHYLQRSGFTVATIDYFDLPEHASNIVILIIIDFHRQLVSFINYT